MGALEKRGVLYILFLSSGQYRMCDTGAMIRTIDNGAHCAGQQITKNEIKK